MDERYELDVLDSLQTTHAPRASLEGDHPSTPNVPLLTGTFDEAVTPSSPLSITRERKRIGWHLLLATFAIVTLSAGCAGFFLLWVTAIHGVRPFAGKSLLLGALEYGAFLADEGTTTVQNSPQTATLRLLSFSNVTTQIISMTAPLLVMMAAYCLAGIWIAEQERPFPGGRNLPTPAQFGFLVKLSSSAGLVSMYQTAQYLRSGTHPKRRAPAPALLYTAIVGVLAIYSVTHMMSAADLWLHFYSSTILWNVTVSIPPAAFQVPQGNMASPLLSDTHFLGVVFNDTLCDPLDGDDDPVATQLCLGRSTGWGTTIPSVALSGRLIALNLSITDKLPADQPNPRLPLAVITLHEEGDLAVIVPSPNWVDDSMTWNASSYGLRVSCQSITDKCLPGGNSTHDCYSQIPGPSLACQSNCTYDGILDCPGVRFPQDLNAMEFPLLTYTATDSLSTMGMGPLYWQSDGGLENPYNIQLLIQWSADDFNDTDPNPELLGIGSLTVANCSVEYFNLTLTQVGGRYSVVNGTMERSSKSFSRIMAGALLSKTYLDRVVDHVHTQILGNQTEENAIPALSQDLARISLGLFAGAVIPAPALTLAKPALLSRYPVAPLLAYVFTLYLYSMLVLAIFVWASTIKTPVVRAANGKETTSLKLGQSLLTDSLTLVGLALPNALRGVDEGSESLLKDPIEMFGEASEERGDVEGEDDVGVGKEPPRLMLDVVDEGPKKGLMFGVREWKPSD